MCGISGIFHFSTNQVMLPDLKKMTDTIAHRGPDGEGQWVNEAGNIGLGHRRLSILDLSTDGKQPMHSLDKRYSITFNGEIYNYKELKNELISKGFTFHTGTDTEVILAAYSFWGIACLNRFDGMFAFALWDEQKQELFCARDRFGEKPFYYFKDKEQFLFASEMKALWAIDVPKSPLPHRIFDYLLFLSVENSKNRKETFFQDIYQLEPAHYLIVKNGELVQKRYWQLAIHNNRSLSIEDAASTFHQMFVSSIEKRMRSDVELGSSLSGGLDSSAIVTTLKKDLQVSKFKTFSAVFPGFKLDESKYIDTVIHATGFESHRVTPDAHSFLTQFDQLMFHQEEPFGSSSIAAQYEVMKLVAKHHVKVLLDGQGADEILAGYPISWNCYLKQVLRTNPAQYRLVRKQLVENQNYAIDVSFKRDLLEAFFFSSSKKIGNLMRNFRQANSSHFLGIDPAFVKEHCASKSPSKNIPNLKKQLSHLLNEGSLQTLLRYADRNSMAHGVEVRLPFLNHDLVSFLFSLPENYLIRDGWSKYILRHAMQTNLPTEIAWRKDKIGYVPPQENWFENKVLKEKLDASIAKLKQEKIISKPIPALNWNYLMLGAMFE